MSKSKKEYIKILGRYRMFLILILAAVILGIIEPKFLTVSNFSNIFKQIATNAILAAGMTFVILTGGIDISVGATLAFVGAVTINMIGSGVNLGITLIAGLAFGAAIGAFNGIFVSQMQLQPMIVTLATQSIFRGLTYIITKGSPIPLDLSLKSGQGYKWIYGGLIANSIPFSFVLVFFVYIVSYYLLNKATYERHIYAVGGSEEAAKLSGINTKLTMILAYVACGVMAAIAGIIISARVASAQPNAGETYEMDAIAAVVIGGTSLRGGEGHVGFTIIGAIIIGMLNNFLNLMGVDTYYQVVVKGVVILLAVLADAKTGKKA